MRARKPSFGIVCIPLVATLQYVAEGSVVLHPCRTGICAVGLVRDYVVDLASVGLSAHRLLEFGSFSLVEP